MRGRVVKGFRLTLGYGWTLRLKSPLFGTVRNCLQVRRLGHHTVWVQPLMVLELIGASVSCVSYDVSKRVRCNPDVCPQLTFEVSMFT